MDKKISQLTAATTPLTGAEELAIVQSGVTKKTTIEDVKGYKVYTALLTQSGGQNTDALEGGNLTIGVTYKIQGVGGGADFTNVGAPNNDIDTWFVATGTAPNSWGTGGSLSYDLGAPVVTVLENTIGNIWFTYGGIGDYYINSSSLFVPNKTAILFGGAYYNGIIDTTVGYGQSFFNLNYPDSLGIGCIKTQGDERTDDVLFNTTIEIRVYN